MEELRGAGRAAQAERARPLRRLLRWVVAGLLALLLGYAAYMGISLWQGVFVDGGSLNANEIVRPLPGERINVLILGVDSVEGVQRSDTMMLVSVDPLKREAGILSIPRDTLAEIPGRPQREKIAHAHAYGGPQLSVAAVSRLLDVPVHYYARLDYEGFEHVIDALGGVTLDVEKRMDYEDPYQDLYIHLKPGRQQLDGVHALEYARYRLDGDLNRIERQHRLIAALAEQAFQVGTVLRLPSLVEGFSKFLDTDMPPATVLQLSRLAREIPADRILMGTVATHPFWVSGGRVYLGEEVDAATTDPRIDLLIRGIDREANAEVAVFLAGGRAQEAGVLSELGYRPRLLPQWDAKQVPAGVVVAPLTPGDEARAAILARELEAAAGGITLLGGLPPGGPGDLEAAEGGVLVIAGGE